MPFAAFPAKDVVCRDAPFVWSVVSDDEEHAVAVAVFIEEQFIGARGGCIIGREKDMVLSLLVAVPVLWA